MRKIEILIVVAVLLVIAALAGCKEKAEADEPVKIVEPDEIVILEITDTDYEIITQEPNHLVIEFWDRRGWYVNKEGDDVVITDRRRVAVNKPYVITKQEAGHLRVDPLPEPDEPKTYTAEELDEIYKDEPALGRLAKDLYGLDRFLNGFSEPDECEGHGVTAIYCPECHDLSEPKPKKYSFPSGLIPTWPDYIELEKDLVIRGPADIREIAGREHDFGVRIELTKGTKIYFKE